MKKISVLKVSLGKRPELITIPHTLEEMQRIVEGSIQAIYPYEDPVALVCNEEGKLLGQKPNRAIRDANGTITEIICGTFFICGLTRENFGSLTKGQIDFYSKLFWSPELFLWNGNNLVVLPMDFCA